MPPSRLAPIDTPGMAMVASGTAYPNFGWTLTQQPKVVPFDGSTIDVLIDGVVVGHPGSTLATGRHPGALPGLREHRQRGRRVRLRHDGLRRRTPHDLVGRDRQRGHDGRDRQPLLHHRQQRRWCRSCRRTSRRRSALSRGVCRSTQAARCSCVRASTTARRSKSCRSRGGRRQVDRLRARARRDSSGGRWRRSAGIAIRGLPARGRRTAGAAHRVDARRLDRAILLAADRGLHRQV